MCSSKDQLSASPSVLAMQHENLVRNAGRIPSHYRIVYISYKRYTNSTPCSE